VNSYEKGRCDNEIAAWPKHLVHISTSSHRPRQVLKNLIRYDKVELSVERLGANIKIGKFRSGIRTEFKSSSPLRAARNFKNIQSLWSDSSYEFKAPPVHDDAKPIRSIKAHFS